MTQNGEHKPTVNGVIKGRPGKGKVLSLGQRRFCYAQPKHAMTEDNTFRYTAKPTESNPTPLEREWCRKCRAASRKRGRARRMEMAKVEARRIKAELRKAMPTTTGEPDAGNADTYAGRPGKAMPKAKASRKSTPKLKGQARIDAQLAEAAEEAA